MRTAFELISNSRLFQTLVISTIVVAVVLVGVESYPEAYAKFGPLLVLLDRLVLTIFILEAVVRIGASFRYFRDPWNIFDFAIVTICLLPINAHYIAAFRVARILRVLRLVSALPQLRILVGSLIKSIPSISFVVILMALHFYIYAIVGTFQFAKNDPIHFGSLHVSLVSLFRVLTLEDWTDLMYIQMYGSDVYSYDSFTGVITEPAATPVISVLYFVSFIVLGTMIILNLLVGVVMNAVNGMHAKREATELAASRQNGSITTSGELKLLSIQLEQIQGQLGLMRDKLDDETIAARRQAARLHSGKQRNVQENRERLRLVV